MQFRLWLEAFQNPPIRPRAWIEEMVQKGKELESKIPIDVEKLILGNKGEESRRFRTLWRDLPTIFKDRVTNRQNGYWSYSDEIQNYINMVDSQHYDRYILKTAGKNLLNISQKDYHYAIVPYHQFNKKFKEELLPEYAEYFGTHSPQYEELVESKKIVDNVYRYLKWMVQFQTQFIRMEEWLNRKDGEHPPHQKVEWLYHATAFTKEILAHGFKTKDQLGGLEVLGGATQNAISFTSDIRIARAIAETIIDAIKIAKGEMNTQDVINLLHQDKVPEETINDLVKRYAKDSPTEQAFEIYSNWFWYANKKYHPLFFGVHVENFAKLDISNVGIIAGKCDMSKIVNVMRTMQEYRVPLDAILEIKKVK